MRANIDACIFETIRCHRLAQDDGLKDPLLGASPKDQRGEVAEEVAAVRKTGVTAGKVPAY